MKIFFNTNVLDLKSRFGSLVIRYVNDTYKLSIFILFLSFTFVSSQVSAQTNKIVMYGDSISAGYGMTLEQSWPHLLNETFVTEGKPYQLINESISGETTGGGLARLENVLNRHKLSVKDWIIIELGGNDGLRGFPIKTLKQNLTQLVSKSKFHGVNVALMQVRIPPNYGKRYTSMFEATYPSVAKENNVPLLPFFMDEVAVNPKYMQRDGIHPNRDAQIIIRDIMKPVIEDLVE